MKKKIFLLPLLTVFLTLGACNKTQKVEPTRASLEMSVINKDNTNYFTYNFDLNAYINLDGKENKDIAKMALMFCSNISSSSKVTFEKEKYETENYTDFKPFYNQLNLDSFKSVKIGKDVENDVNDITLINMAHKKINVDGKDYEICFVTLEDSGGNASWISNFDIGSDDDNYYSKTGQHNEWTNKENHKGFDVTANRCLPVVQNYVSDTLDKNSQQILYVFGHSRGGALANILSAKLIDLDYKIVSYGFASPGTTTSKDANNAKYNNIHNYICEEDMVASLLPKNLEFTRYGKTTSFKIKDYSVEFAQLNGISLPNASTEIIVNIFSNLVSTRSEIYQFSDKFLISPSKTMNQGDADSYIKQYTDAFTDGFEDLINFINIEKNCDLDDTGLVTIKINSCVAFYLQLLATILSQAMGNLSSAVSYILRFNNYLQIILDVSGIKTTDLLALDFNMCIYVHFYYSYMTYINL